MQQFMVIKIKFKRNKHNLSTFKGFSNVKKNTCIQCFVIETQIM